MMEGYAAAIVMAWFLGAGNVYLEHGVGQAYIPLFTPEDTVVWSVTWARPECHIEIEEEGASFVRWHCTEHRDCNAKIGWMAWRPSSQAPTGPRMVTEP